LHWLHRITILKACNTNELSKSRRHAFIAEGSSHVPVAISHVRRTSLKHIFMYIVYIFILGRRRRLTLPMTILQQDFAAVMHV